MNLLETLKQQFAGEALSQVTNLLGENENQIKTALSSLVPSMLASVMATASSTTGSQKIVDLIRAEEQKGTLTDSLNNMISEGTIRGLLTQDSPLVANLFGSKAGFIIDAVTRLSGIKRESASSLIRIATPLIIGAIGKWLKGQGDVRSALVSLATSQLGALKSLVPPSLLGDLGLPDVVTKLSSVSKISDDYGTSTDRSSWAPYIALPILAFVAYWIFGGKTQDQTAEIKSTTQQTQVVAENAINNAEEALRQAENDIARASADLEKVTDNKKTVLLPGNVQLKVEPDSFIDKFLNAIKAPKSVSGGVLHDTTGAVKPNLTFDKVDFANGATTLTPDSKAQLDDLATVLKAYPETEIKIIGYTDSSGDAKKNLMLSAARAETVKGYLKEMAGIAASRITTTGKGALQPVADNAKEEGRQKNRRVEVEIVKGLVALP